MLRFPYYLLAEWLCFVVAILLIKKPVPRYWNVIKYYLGIVVATESIAYYLGWMLKSNNQWIYNLFMVVEFSFDIWFISRLWLFSNFRALIYTAFISFVIVYFIEWHQVGITTFFEKTCIYGSVVAILFCMVYFYSLFQTEHYVNLLKEPAFWFISGCFIFYATSIGVDTFFSQLVRVKIKHTVSLRYIIMNVLNIILYCFWIKAFICLKIKEKYISQL